MSNSEKAAEVFDSGFNCAQAVLSVYAERFGMDKEQSLRLTDGFGSGIARMQETCGAVTGAIMVIGLAMGERINEYSERKEKTYALIHEFIRCFKERNNSIKCSELLKCDINTDEGIYFYDVNELHEKVCMKCVADSAQILVKLIL